MKRYPRTVACIVWYDDKIALSQRLATKTFSGKWEAVGGKVEDGEFVGEGIVREVTEEMNIFIPIWEMTLLDCITDDPTTEKCFIFEAQKYAVQFSSVKNREKRKRTAWQLFTPQEALKLDLMPGLRPWIERRLLLLQKAKKNT